MLESTAAAADYADALLAARKAKNILASLILVMLLFQLGLFFWARYKFAVDAPSHTADFLKYGVGLSDFLGVAATIVLAIVLLFIVLVMLNGRLLGVSRLVSAFLWCIVLAVLLFPWQAFLMNQTFTSTEFKIPGVLYTWAELAARGRLHPPLFCPALLYWARFVGCPAVATVILLVIQHQSRRGLRMALGNADPPPVVTENP
jgi:magnesium-transporting ATPase (P-type)